MQKTVQVVDEAGMRYEATWEWRARGLVKNGRARFIDENTICLACPPNKQNIISEDMKMTNTENIKENKLTAEAAAVEETALTAKYSLEYALDQIGRIANVMSVVMKALDTISTMENEPTLENGGSADELAKAAADIVRCREVTNQKLIAFYEKVVEDCRPRREDRQSTEL